MHYNPKNSNSKLGPIDGGGSLLNASNLAGLAFSKTKTAAAHSISYPLTIHYNVPHGIACSLPLLPLLEINREVIENELKQLLRKANLINITELKNRIKQIFTISPKFNLVAWGVTYSELEYLANLSFTKERMSNNIIKLDITKVKQVLEILLSS